MHRVRTFCAIMGLTAVVAAALVGTATVLAQNPDPNPKIRAASSGEQPESLASLMRGIGSGPQIPVTILMAPAVQRELKLTDAQKTKAYQLSLAASQKQRDQFQANLLGGNVDPRAMRATRDEMRSQNEQGVARILDDTQQERFNQIVLQAEGPISVARPDVSAKLRLNDTQKEYVQSIVMQMQQSQFQLFMRMRQAAATGQFNPGQIPQVREMMSKLRDEAGQQIGKVIDRKQKNAFNAMLGKPFDLSKLEDGAGAGDGSADAPGAEAKETSKAKADTNANASPEPEEPAPKKKTTKGATKPSRKPRTRTPKTAQ